MKESSGRTRLMIYAIIALWIVIIATLAYSTFLAPSPAISTQFNLSVSGNEAFITHTGGDPLPCDSVAILLNDREVPFPKDSIECPWSIGETVSISLPRSGSPVTIRIVSSASPKGSRELFSAEIPAMTPLATPSPPPTPATPGTTPATLVPTMTPTPAPTLIPIDTLGAPVAAFTAEPREGPVPLTVRFTDTSRGIPGEWSWTFGDGETSTIQNPVHTYTKEGSYQVGLTVRNAFGGHTRISQGFITVTPAENRDVYLEAQRDARVPAGGFLEFTVREGGSRVKIGGTVIDLPPGARVRLTLPAGGKGKVSIRSGKILGFSFENTVLSIDGEVRGQGEVREISVQGYDDLVSSLVLVVSQGPGTVRLLESGIPVDLPSADSPLLLNSARPDPAGILNIDCFRPDSAFFQGAVSGYSFGPV